MVDPREVKWRMTTTEREIICVRTNSPKMTFYWGVVQLALSDSGTRQLSAVAVQRYLQYIKIAHLSHFPAVPSNPFKV